MYDSIIFHHVPKSAGSTLTEIIRRQYANEEFYKITTHPSVQASIKKFTLLPKEKKEKIRCVAGHGEVGKLNRYLKGRTAHITMLRDPVERIISHYYYVQMTPNHYLYKSLQSKKWSLQEYVKESGSMEFKNWMVRHMSEVNSGDSVSESDLKEAKQKIDNRFAAVGITERFDESLLLMKRLFGWRQVYYQKRNVTKKRPRKEKIDQSTLQTIKSHNHYDIRLYNYAFEKLKSDLDEVNLGRDLRMLMMKCAAFKAKSIASNNIRRLIKLMVKGKK